MKVALVASVMASCSASSKEWYAFSNRGKARDDGSFSSMRPESSLPTTAVVGGEDASLGQFPWMVAVLGAYPGSGSALQNQYCGAVLVAPNAALSAKHCFLDEDGNTYDFTFSFLVGARSLRSWESETPSFGGYAYAPQVVGWSEIYVHTVYDSAIVVFDAAVDIPYVTVASTVEASLATLSGWGNIDNSDTQPSILQFLDDVPLVDDAECFIDPSFIPEAERCAGYSTPGRGACVGDSGGPLLVANSSTDAGYELVGNVIRGTTTCAIGYPDMYYDPVAFKADMEALYCGGDCLPWTAPDATDYDPTPQPFRRATPSPTIRHFPEPTRPPMPAPKPTRPNRQPEPTRPPMPVPKPTRQPKPDPKPTRLPMPAPKPTRPPIRRPGPKPTTYYAPSHVPTDLGSSPDTTCSCMCTCPGGVEFGYDYEFPYQSCNATTWT